MKPFVFTALDLRVLPRLLADAGIKLVDIGGRGSGFRAFVPLAPFADYYVAEPEPNEASRLEQELAAEAPWRSVTVIPQAIASREGEAGLHMTAVPGLSSLLPPDAEVAKRFFLGDTFRVESVTKVPTIGLDAAASRYGFQDACFLKLDTQGTELEVLQSGSRLVGESVLGVYVECSFRPFYQGQPLFGDVDRYLRERGFALFTLQRTNVRRAGFRPEMYSKRVTVWAHCLYLREPDTLHHTAGAAGVTRLLALALAFQHYDLALELVAAARNRGLAPEPELGALIDDVDLVVSAGTALMMRRAGKRGLRDVLMGAAFRDRRQLE